MLRLRLLVTRLSRQRSNPLTFLPRPGVGQSCPRYLIRWLMTAQEILTMTRYQLDDEQAHYKWSDAELVVYLNMALHEVCRRCYLLRDSTTTTICRLTLATNTFDYALSPLVTHIANARIVGESRFMTRRIVAELNERTPAWRDEDAALPTEFLTDYTSGFITVRPKPSVTYNGVYMWLQTYRLPATDISALTLSSTPEILAGYHPYLADFILSRAFLKPGQLTFSQFKAQYHMSMWEKNIGKIQEAEWRLKRVDTQEIAAPDGGNT